MPRHTDPDEHFGLLNLQVFHRCTPAEAADWRERWRAVYARDGRGAGLHRYLWHTFSAGRFPALAGAASEAAYATHTAPEYVVLPNHDAGALVSMTRPVRDRYNDVLVFPRNLAWTMAFTHEDGYLGPYFARHPDYERLQADNLQALEKRSQIEAAKRRGWV